MVWTAGATDDKLRALGLDPQQLLAEMRDAKAREGHGFTAAQAGGGGSKARCLAAMAGVLEPVRRLIGATPSESLVEHGIYERPAELMGPQCFGAGRVAIVGDAAHPLRPTGQGLNQTLEDAWALGHALLGADAGGGGVDLARLDAFRAARAARVRVVAAHTSAIGRGFYERRAGDGEAEAARAWMGWTRDGAALMSAEDFNEFCVAAEFEALAAAAS